MLSWLKHGVTQSLREWWRRCRLQIQLSNELGVWGGLTYVIHHRKGARGTTFRLRSRHANHPLYLRGCSSDSSVFSQVFLELEYSPLCNLSDVRLVIDCGANIGCSSVFFLSQFPSCHVVAVEPDPDNFAMLQRNLRAYTGRAKVVRAGIWSHSAPLSLSREPYRDGREWAVQVRIADEFEEPNFPGVSIGSLLGSFGCNRISLLKMDIEGAEAVVFRKNTDWLERVDAIAIELHDDSQFGRATDVFYAAIRGRGFDVSRSGELTICRRSAEPG